MVVITMKDGGTITLELDKSAAPITASNFESLVLKGFYDGLTFHRILYGFMVQGGDPQGNGRGGPGYTIKGEFNSNGWNNPLKHTRGVISMARSSNPDSAGSQFFIVHEDSPHLDGDYAAFGKMLDGFEVLDRIASVNVNSSDRPLQPVEIESIRIVE